MEKDNGWMASASIGMSGWVRASAIILGALACLSGASWAADPVGPTLRTVESQLLAKGALLYDPLTKKVVFSRNPDQPFAPASTVKLMTALLVWEEIGLHGSVKVTLADTKVVPSHIPLMVGETVAVKDLVYSLLIGSDNDSAMALARKVAGSVPAFAELANARARALGCRQTNFVNPNGLTAQGQVTTANDLLKIFQAVIAVPELRAIAQTRSFQLTTQRGTQNVRNHNRLLGTYEGMGPAKTGWTIASRHTYAASVTREGRELQLIILNSPNKWTDARLLFDYGFANLPKGRNTLSSARQAAAAPVPRARPVLPEGEAPPPGVEVSVPVVEAVEPVVGATPVSKSHRVQRGDTLYRIGQRYRVPVADLIAENDLKDPDQLMPGTVLKIPARR